MTTRPPIIRFDERSAQDAYAAYAALAKAEAADPSLDGNEYWRALRDTAFARFRAAFEVR